MKMSELKTGQRVVATDGGSKRGTMIGTVRRLVGKRGLGGGVHARVDWENGSNGLHRPDHLELVKELAMKTMVHCGWFRAKDGTPIHAPRFPGPPTKLSDHARVVSAWTVENVANSRPAHDPDHPFDKTIPCPCGR